MSELAAQARDEDFDQIDEVVLVAVDRGRERAPLFLAGPCKPDIAARVLDGWRKHMGGNGWEVVVYGLVPIEAHTEAFDVETTLVPDSTRTAEALEKAEDALYCPNELQASTPLRDRNRAVEQATLALAAYLNNLVRT